MSSEILSKKLQGFQLIAQEKLQAILCSIPGKKDLILDKSLIKQLEHICSASWLKFKGINRIFKFDQTHFPNIPDNNVQVFMLRSEMSTFNRILEHLLILKVLESHEPEVSLKRIHLICVPGCLGHFQNMLEEQGLWGVVQLHSFSWDFICLDESLLSLEIPNIFATAFLQGDSSLMPSIAKSLRILMSICGQPELIISYGYHSENILKMLECLGPLTKNNSQKLDSQFGCMVIIDRDKDYASSLLTPSIYAGLLLEVFEKNASEILVETNNNKIRVQKLAIFEKPSNEIKDKKSKPNTATKPIRIQFNSLNDEIYGENRYKHFAQASSLIRAQAKAIGLEVHKLSDMKLDEMHDYVARKLPKIAELKAKVLAHLKSSEVVIEMLAGNFRRLQNLEQNILNNVSRKRLLSEIEEILATDAQRYNTLRLLCLLYLCSSLSGSDELTQFIRNYCNVFGHQHIGMFHRMATAGLLPQLAPELDKLNKSTAKLLSTLPLTKFGQTDFQANANRLKLLVSETAPDAAQTAALSACPSYVFNNLYIPLIAQLCSIVLKSNSNEEFVTKLGMIDKLQLHVPYEESQSDHNSYKCCTVKELKRTVFPLKKRHLLVYVVGGVTYAEVAACNMINKLTGAQIVIASDCIISGSDLMAAAEEV